MAIPWIPAYAGLTTLAGMSFPSGMAKKAAVALAILFLTLCLSCAVNKVEDAKDATKIGGLDAALQISSSGSSAFHNEVHPAYWSAWTTDGAAPVQSDSVCLTRGLRCSVR